MKTVTVDGSTITYSYDDYGRLTKQETKKGETTVLTEEYTFTDGTVNNEAVTSSQIATYKVTSGNTVTTYTYTYDDNGNILSVSDGTKTTSYVYDSANQLIRENNQSGNFTHTWQYDNGGNILNRKEYAYTTGTLGTPTKTVTYGYGDILWGDLLKTYDGKAISYDAIGNPTSDGTLSYTWEHGRQLASVTKGSNTWEYTYNADGMRVKKALVGGTAPVSFVYNGSQLVRMETNGRTLDFTYDPSGHPFTLTYNGTTYYYVTNVQGDVIGIRDANGTLKVSYQYDAWGNIVNDSGDFVLLTLNPLLYRGYVYDQETGLYYLQSRYYNPKVGRFINADGQMSDVGGDILGYNMFAYCVNNPVNMSDPDGNWPKILKEIGARLTHVLKFMVRTVTSPLKAITLEVGGGVGYGASAKALVAEIPVEVGAYATITDSYIYDKGTHDVRNTSSAKIGLNVGNSLDLSYSAGKSHSYFDAQCSCSFWNSTFGEKSDCVANKKHVYSEATLGISAGLYLAIGFEFSISFDFNAWGNEIISIYHDSLSFEGYYS